MTMTMLAPEPGATSTDTATTTSTTTPDEVTPVATSTASMSGLLIELKVQGDKADAAATKLDGVASIKQARGMTYLICY